PGRHVRRHAGAHAVAARQRARPRRGLRIDRGRTRRGAPFQRDPGGGPAASAGALGLASVEAHRAVIGASPAGFRMRLDTRRATRRDAAHTAMLNVALRIASVGCAITAIAATATGCGSASKVGPSASKRAHDGPLVYEISTEPQRPATATQLAERLPDGTTRRLPRLPGGARQPAWSPDRTRIAFVRGLANAAYEINRVLTGRQLPRARTEIDTADAAGRDVRRLVSDCPATPGCLFDALPAWAPDGRISFLRFYGPVHSVRQPYEHQQYASRVELLTIPASGGRPATIRRWDADLQPWDGAPRWSPDGRH